MKICSKKIGRLEWQGFPDEPDEVCVIVQPSHEIIISTWVWTANVFTENHPPLYLSYDWGNGILEGIINIKPGDFQTARINGDYRYYAYTTVRAIFLTH